MKYQSNGITKKALINIPLITALLVNFLLVFVLENSVLRSTAGIFMYPLDDPFIHMKVAQNLAFNSTWGINPGEFGSASSSIFYTLLLAGIFKIFSASVLVPFLVNCIVAIFLLTAIDKWLRKQEVGSTARMIMLLSIIFFTPLPVIIISGMEHTLQCLFTFLFVTGFCDWLESMRDTTGKSWKLPWKLLLYAMLVTAIRYEGLFLIAIAGLILLYYRKIFTAFQLGLLALVPVIVFGLYSISQHSYFLPNSVLVKSDEFHFSVKGITDFFSNILVNKLTVTKTDVKLPGVPPPGISLLTTQRLLIILPLAYLVFYKQLRQRSSYRHIIFVLTMCSVLHLAFAATGWFYRYEAYLVMSAVLMVMLLLYKYGKELLQEKQKYAWVLSGVLLFALCFPFVLRSTAAFTKAKQACINIYQQQYQMAQFVRTNYNNDVIAANDIGAISYYSNAKLVDLWGLGSIEVAKSKKKKYWTPVFLDSLVRAKKVRVAIVYDEWFDPALLHNWTKIATWQIYNNVITGGDTVSFYAINKEEGEDLREKLHAFQSSLPQGITVIYQ